MNRPDYPWHLGQGCDIHFNRLAADTRVALSDTIATPLRQSCLTLLQYHLSDTIAAPLVWYYCSTTCPILLQHHLSDAIAAPLVHYYCSTTCPMLLQHHLSDTIAAPLIRCYCSTTCPILFQHHLSDTVAALPYTKKTARKNNCPRSNCSMNNGAKPIVKHGNTSVVKQFCQL